MNEAVFAMLKPYDCRSAQDHENALKEIIQEIVLLGLWRSKFFEKAAFYGGSALRIAYGIDRFSEDLDFSLLKADRSFNLAKYREPVVAELASFGFDVNFNIQQKLPGNPIQSAFVKAGTLVNMIAIQVPEPIVSRLHKNAVLRVKFEIDTDPPMNFDTTVVQRLLPIPFSINTYSINDLLAGKVSALLCRTWKKWVKGRDWYDFVWLVSRKIPLHLAHLQKRLEQTGHWDKANVFDMVAAKALIVKKIEDTDFSQAKADIMPFIKNTASVSSWSKDFFLSLVDTVKTI